jgi:hypothetical protein
MVMHDAVEMRREENAGANRGKFCGMILCLPTSGDETGDVAKLQEEGVFT